jgi:nucleoside-diphosphate kinase
MMSGLLAPPVAPVIRPGYKPRQIFHLHNLGKLSMALERTFSIIKPDAGLRVIASKRIHMTKAQAEGFYAVHKERPFFNDLVSFMISGPVVVQVLEGENAVAKNREIMGATNPANADAGTIRKDFAESIEANSVHGSDAPETAAEEIKYFFKDEEIVG